jgi:hypothetical protein
MFHPDQSDKSDETTTRIPAQMNLILHCLKVSTIFFAVALLSGCSKKSASGRFEPLTGYMKQQDQLTAGYLHGDAVQARKSLGDLLKFYQAPGTKPLADAARAQMVFQTYSRLFILETRTGNPAEAEAALARVREAQEQFYKLANVSDKDLAAAKQNLTPEKIQAMVDEMDERENRGQPPQYLQTAKGAAH